MASALVLHLLSATVWVGGMFFAYMILRPVAAELLEPPLRLTLWVRVFNQFFVWVWLALLTLVLSGYGMLFQVFGGMRTAPLYVHVMQGGGLVMIAIFLHVYFAPYRSLRRAVDAQEWQLAGQQLAQIRRLVAANLILGLSVVAIAGGGRILA